MTLEEQNKIAEERFANDRLLAQRQREDMLKSRLLLVTFRIDEMMEELQSAILDAGGFVEKNELFNWPVTKLLETFANNNIKMFAYWREPVQARIRQHREDQAIKEMAERARASSAS